jgi:hypothetical protein
VRGYDLVALIFAREITDDLTGLVKTIDNQLDETMTRQKRTTKLGVFVIVLTDDPKVRQKAMELPAREGLKQVVVSTHASEGPKRYKVAREADLTVVVWKDRQTVSANFPLKKGGLDCSISWEILAALNQVLPGQ